MSPVLAVAIMAGLVAVFSRGRRRGPSRNFTWADVERSGTAAELGIDNTIPPRWRANAQRLAVDVLEPLQEAAGPIRVTSWYRHWRVNDAVGGVAGSQHMEGRAADVVSLAGKTPAQLRQAIEDLDLDELVLYAGHLHVAVGEA